MGEAFETLVREITHARSEMLERACEEAIQGGLHGVVVDDRRGVAWVDPRVPYGRIYDVSACGAENVVWDELD